MLFDFRQVQRLARGALYRHCRRSGRRHRRHNDQVAFRLKTWPVLGVNLSQSGAVLLGRLRYRGFGQLYPVENVESGSTRGLIK